MITFPPPQPAASPISLGHRRSQHIFSHKGFGSRSSVHDFATTYITLRNDRFCPNCTRRRHMLSLSLPAEKSRRDGRRVWFGSVWAFSLHVSVVSPPPLSHVFTSIHRTPSSSPDQRRWQKAGRSLEKNWWSTELYELCGERWRYTTLYELCGTRGPSGPQSPTASK